MKAQPLLAFLLLILALLPSAGINAQTAKAQACTPIAYGQSVNGNFNANMPFEPYCFSGMAGDIIRIEMNDTSGGMVDPFLELYDTNGQFLASDDDNTNGLSPIPPGPFDSLLEVTLPATGNYTIIATSISGIGNYTLTLTNVSGGTSTIGGGPGGGSIMFCANATAIGSVQPVSGFLDNGNPIEFWCFSGIAGETVEISMAATSGNLDTLVELADANGSPLIDNDNVNAVTTDSYLTYVLPSTGDYGIRALRGGNASSSGNYNLFVTLSSSTSTGSTGTTGTFCNNQGFTGYSQPTGGLISSFGQQDIWCFSGTAGDQIIIQLNADPGSSLDPFVELVDNSGISLAFDDDSAQLPLNSNGLNSYLEFKLPYSGDYGIVVRNCCGNTTGAYNLSVTLASGSPGSGTGDTDGDGVPDNADQCPTQSGGVYGVDNVGCPVNDPIFACNLSYGAGSADCVDADGDGFPTIFDLCPGQAGVAPNGCPVAPTVTVPTSATGGIQIQCANGQIISNGVMVTVNMRGGFDYTATAVGIGGFDPVLAVVQPNGTALCNDDHPRAADYTFTLPTTGRIPNDALSSRVTFRFGQRGSFGNVQLVVGGFAGGAGEYVLFLEGMFVTDEDGAGDPFTLELTSNLVNAAFQPVVYMVGVGNRLDPYISVFDDQFNPFFDAGNFLVYCDDGGNANRCNAPGQSLQGSSITTDKRTQSGDTLDAMLFIPVSSPVAGRALTNVSFLMTSLGQQSLGEYILAFHLATQ